MARLTITPGDSGCQWLQLRSNENQIKSAQDKNQGSCKMMFKIRRVMHEYMHNRGACGALAGA